MVNTVTTADPRVETYFAGVAASLGDLPRADREDLLEEVREHLGDLVQESDAPLTVRLGEPEAYAAELRASAGLPPRGRTSRVAVTRTLGSARDAMMGQPWVRPAREFLTSVRPLWWVARAWLLVTVVFVVLLNAQWSSHVPVVPRLWSGPIGVLVVLAASVVSIQVGRHSWGPRGRRAMAGVNVVLAIAALPVLSSLADATQFRLQRSAMVVQYYPQVPQPGVLSQGEPVHNIYPYDAAGHLLTDVRLYDDNGRPLDLHLGYDPNRRAVFDRTGQLATNAFPLRYFEPGTRVVAHPAAGPQVVAPPLVPQPMRAGATPSPLVTTPAQ
jgi:hypothetical protein